MTLYSIPQPPLPPTYKDLEQAIIAWSKVMSGEWTVPAFVHALAERLVACQKAPQTRVEPPQRSLEA